MNRYDINIGLLGCVSSGKTTFLQMIGLNKFSETTRRRNTMIPQVYKETNDILKQASIEHIYRTNTEINKYLVNKTKECTIITSDDIKEEIFYVPKFKKLTNLKDNVYLNVYDIPGLNDSQTKNVYFKYVKKNMIKFDIIIFLLDITSCLSTSGEIEILNMILDEIRENYIKYDKITNLMILINKCDDMTNIGNGKYELTGEDKDAYGQGVIIIKDSIAKKCPNINYNILPISCEDAYIYRVYQYNQNVKLDKKYVDKFGWMEYGKVKWNKLSEQDKDMEIKQILENTNYEERMEGTGFYHFKEELHKICSGINQLKFANNQVKVNVKRKFDININMNYTNINNDINEMKSIVNVIDNIFNYFSYDNNLNNQYKEIYEKDLKFINKIFSYYISNYLDKFKITKYINRATKKNIDKCIEIYNMLDNLNSNLPYVGKLYNDIYIGLKKSINTYKVKGVLKSETSPTDVYIVFKQIAEEDPDTIEQSIYKFLQKNKKIKEEEDYCSAIEYIINEFNINYVKLIDLIEDKIIELYNSYKRFGLISSKYNFWRNLYDISYNKHILYIRGTIETIYLTNYIEKDYYEKDTYYKNYNKKCNLEKLYIKLLKKQYKINIIHIDDIAKKRLSPPMEDNLINFLSDETNQTLHSY